MPITLPDTELGQTLQGMRIIASLIHDQILRVRAAMWSCDRLGDDADAEEYRRAVQHLNRLRQLQEAMCRMTRDQGASRRSLERFMRIVTQEFRILR